MGKWKILWMINIFYEIPNTKKYLCTNVKNNVSKFWQHGLSLEKKIISISNYVRSFLNKCFWFGNLTNLYIIFIISTGVYTVCTFYTHRQHRKSYEHSNAGQKIPKEKALFLVFSIIIVLYYADFYNCFDK